MILLQDGKIPLGWYRVDYTLGYYYVDSSQKAIAPIKEGDIIYSEDKLGGFRDWYCTVKMPDGVTAYVKPSLAQELTPITPQKHTINSNIKEIKGATKWLLDAGNLSVGQWDFKNISNDSFGADGKTTSSTPTATVPADIAKGKSSVDLTTEFSSLANKLYIPYIGLGLGYFGAAYMGNKRNSSTMGYLGWMGLGAVIGLGGGLAIALSMGKKQLAAAGDKMNAAKVSSSVGDSASTGDLNSRVEKATRDMVLVAASANVPQKKAKTEGEIKADIDKVEAGLTDAEKKIYIDYVNMMADMMKKISASTQATPAANSPEAVKLLSDMMNGLQAIDDTMEKKYGKDVAAAFNEKMNKLGIL